MKQTLPHQSPSAKSPPPCVELAAGRVWQRFTQRFGGFNEKGSSESRENLKISPKKEEMGRRATEMIFIGNMANSNEAK